MKQRMKLHTKELRSLIDDIGYEGFNPGFMESHIDGDAVADYMEDWFYDDMNDSTRRLFG